MKLKRYMAERDLTCAAFAEQMDVMPMTVWRWANGKRFPEPRYLQRIQEVTGYKVTFDDFEIPN